jgi:hypothetical protein
MPLFGKQRVLMSNPFTDSTHTKTGDTPCTLAPVALPLVRHATIQWAVPVKPFATVVANASPLVAVGIPEHAPVFAPFVECSYCGKRQPTCHLVADPAICSDCAEVPDDAGDPMDGLVPRV